MATLNRTFSVKNGIDVANTIIIDSSRNLSNIATANATTVNATTFITTGGLNVTDQANNARDQANTARDQANSARGQANTGYGQANDAYSQANTARGQANTARDVANAAYNQANTSYLPSVTRLDVTNSGANAYRFDQYGSAVDDPTLYVRAGETIAFNLNNAGHPFVIRVSDGGANYDTGLTHVAADGTVSTGSSAQGKVAGTLYWKVPSTLGGNTYVYQCTVHAGMVGNIVIEPPMVIAYAQANTARDTANGAYSQANGAYAQANGAYAQANGAYSSANGAYAQANGAYSQANGAYAQANTAYGQANDAYSQANTGYAQANAAYGKANAAANTVWVYANGGSILSSANLNFNNTATINVAATANGTGQANIAFAVNTAALSTIGSPTVPITISSNVTVSKDLTVTGNLRVEGDTTTFNVSSLAVEDSEIILNSNQAGSPALNASIFVERGSSTDTFLRWNEGVDEWGWSDDGANTYYFEDLRQGLITHNTTFGTVNTTFGTVNTTFGTVNTTFGTVNTSITTAHNQANTARDQANTARTTANDSYAQANTARTQANTARDQANTAYGQANAAYGQANTARDQANTARTQANAAYADSNTRVLKSGDTMTGALTITVSGTGLTVANANVTGNLTVGTLNVTSNTVTTSATGQAVLDSFATSALASAKYFVQVKSGTDYHTTEVIVVQDATNVWLTEYGSIQTGPSLGTFSADINTGNCRLLFTPTNATNTIRSIRYGVIP
jgi:hypothetical protein